MKDYNNISKASTSHRVIRTVLIIVAFTVLLSALTSARNVVSNSADWRDVYSTILYGNLAGITPHFLTGTAHGPIMLYEISTSSDGVEIITSADRPFYIGYEALFRARGYQSVQETILNSANLELARRLTQINNYIIIDDAYGYNALAVAPYAAKAKYYVLFANRRNIEDISDFLATKTVGKIIIYGHTDREVRTQLSGYNPEIINAETGSRFENNMLILDKYEEIGSIKQVILSNGEFIESSMMTGNEPVLFIGKNNVPAEVKNYIKKKGIEIGVLIGNELIGSATDIRRQLGISVFVKFARGSRVPGGTINPVEDLDRFPMPSYSLSLSIASISYNRATGQLEVSYRNNVNLATYFTTTITLFDADGASMAVVGDESPVFISGAETKTIVYSKLNIEQQRLADNVSAEIYTVYGESKTSLENAIRGRFSIEMIDVKDDTNIEIVDLVYDKTAGKFIVTIENIGKVDAFVRAEIVELWVNRVYTTAGSDEPVLVSSGKKKRIPVVIELEDEDLEHSRNSRITVRAPFGERKLALIKVKTKQFDLKIKELNLYLYAAISIMVLIILFLLLSRKRKKKKCSRCRAINETDAKLCKKCGYELN